MLRCDTPGVCRASCDRLTSDHVVRSLPPVAHSRCSREAQLWLFFSYQYLGECLVSNILCFYVLRMVFDMKNVHVWRVWATCNLASIHSVVELTLNLIQHDRGEPFPGWVYDLSYLFQAYYFFHILSPLDRIRASIVSSTGSAISGGGPGRPGRPGRLDVTKCELSLSGTLATESPVHSEADRDREKR